MVSEVGCFTTRHQDSSIDLEESRLSLQDGCSLGVIFKIYCQQVLPEETPPAIDVDTSVGQVVPATMPIHVRLLEELLRLATENVKNNKKKGPVNREICHVTLPLTNQPEIVGIIPRSMLLGSQKIQLGHFRMRDRMQP